MAETWDKIFRQVAMQSNLLSANDAATLETNYTNPVIGSTELADRATQFPFSAINDAILNAADRMVQLIGLDRASPYRIFFGDVTANIATGGLIPQVGSTGAKIQGVIGGIKDGTNDTKLIKRDYQDVTGIANMPTLKQASSIYWYYTDNVRIWHTRTNVKAEVVVWDKDAQRVLMSQAVTRGNCPFPENTHYILISGAKALLSRDGFNTEQSAVWRNEFNSGLPQLAPNLSNEEIEKRVITD